MTIETDESIIIKKGTKIYYRDPYTHTISKGKVLSCDGVIVQVYTGCSVICIKLSHLRVVE